MSLEVIISKTIGPPRWICRLCHAPFWDEPQFNRHLLRCYKEYEAEVQATNPKHVMPTFYGDEAGDPELAEYWRRNPPRLDD